MDRNELKIQALIQQIQELTGKYEGKIADLRIDVTILMQENERLKKEAEAKDEVEEASPSAPAEA